MKSTIYSSNTGCPRKMLVAGSVGPYGACQHDGSEYTGKYVDNMTIQVRKGNCYLTYELWLLYLSLTICAVIAQLYSRLYSTVWPAKIHENVSWLNAKCWYLAMISNWFVLLSKCYCIKNMRPFCVNIIFLKPIRHTVDWEISRFFFFGLHCKWQILVFSALICGQLLTRNISTIAAT